MTRYLISFDDDAMTFPDEDLPNVAKAAHEVVQGAKDAGLWVFGGGVESQRGSVVATEHSWPERVYRAWETGCGADRGERGPRARVSVSRTQPTLRDDERCPWDEAVEVPFRRVVAGACHLPGTGRGPALAEP